MSTTASHEEPLAFWKRALAGAPEQLELPTDRPRPAALGDGRATASITIPHDVVARLDELAQAERATRSTAMAAALVVLLHRYTAQDDILVAAPSAQGATVLRARLDREHDFRELLRQVRDWTRDALANPVDLERLSAALMPSASQASLCRVSFAYAGADAPPPAAGAPRCDLAVRVSETADGAACEVDFSTELFDRRTVDRLCAHYRAILATAAHDPAQSVRTLPMLTERERTRVLYEWNDTHEEIPDTCAHRLFEEQVTRTPDRTAVVFDDDELAYCELDERANRLAHYLQKRGVGPEVLVGVCLRRSTELATALFAVWKAGGAYVPLDPTLPKDRLAFMLRDASAKVLVTDSTLASHFAADGPSVVSVDTEWPAIEEESATNPEAPVASSNLAYVMYTSGSTGQPKGVMIVHRGLVNYLLWAKKAYASASGDAVPVHSSIAFDLTVTALYTPLVAGGAIEMLREDVGGQNLVASMRHRPDRSLVKITPAHLALLSEQLGAQGVDGRAKLFVIGGENLLAESLTLWRDRAPDTRLVNEYGPTETVVGCCVHEVAPSDARSGSVPIGRPIANTRLYVLDRFMNPQPPGVVGELYIGGAGVARGYLNRPELTRERFVRDPFWSADDARIYKTGDLARYRDDGTLEYLGRVDNQVKVRGYRIELGEIEAALADRPGVKACAVLAREDVPGNKQLVAYVVREDGAGATSDALRRALGESLPEYMVPSQVVFLDAMPLTTNGKIDRKALPAPSAESSGRARVAPRTPHEEKLVEIWRAILGQDDVGVTDDFFDLGGHSLQAIQAVTRIQEVFDVALSGQALFEAPTIAQLAELLGKEDYEPTWSSIVPIQTGGSRTPFFLVHAIGGNVFNYRLLSKHVGTEQPFYGLQARGLSGAEAPHESIEEMAADYIREMRELQPSGPYRLGGSSSGGVIAYEMAQQLLARGDRVEPLVMLDTVFPGPPPARIRNALGGSRARRMRMRFDYHLGGVLRRTPRDALDYVVGLVNVRRTGGPAGQLAAAMKLDNPTLANVIAKNRAALAAYQPRPYPGTITMLLSCDEPDRAFYDLRLAWADLAGGGLTVRFMPGDHENMLDEPQVKGVAAVLAQCLR